MMMRIPQSLNNPLQLQGVGLEMDSRNPNGRVEMFYLGSSISNPSTSVRATNPSIPLMDCERCSEEIVRNSNSQKFCKKCYAEQRKEYIQKWQEDNRAEINKQKRKIKRVRNNYLKEYFEINKDKINENRREGYCSPSVKSRINFIKAKRRANKLKVIHDFTEEEWVNKVIATKGICPSCNKFVGIDKLTLDHIIAISKAKRGQVYTIKEVQPLCKGCNSSKGNR